MLRSIFRGDEQNLLKFPIVPPAAPAPPGLGGFEEADDVHSQVRTPSVDELGPLSLLLLLLQETERFLTLFALLNLRLLHQVRKASLLMEGNFQ